MTCNTKTNTRLRSLALEALIAAQLTDYLAGENDELRGLQHHIAKLARSLEDLSVELDERESRAIAMSR